MSNGAYSSEAMIRSFRTKGEWVGSWETMIPSDDGYVGDLLGDLNVHDLFPDTDNGDEYELRSETPSSLPTARVLGFWTSVASGAVADDGVRRAREYARLRKEVTSPRTGKVHTVGSTTLQTASGVRRETLQRALVDLRLVRRRQQQTMCALAVILGQTCPDVETCERHLGSLQGWWSGLVGTTPRAGPRARIEPADGIRYRTPEEVFESVTVLLSPMRPVLERWVIGGFQWDAVNTATGFACYQADWVKRVGDALRKLFWYHIPAQMLIAHDAGDQVPEPEGRGDADKFARVVEALTLLVLMSTPDSRLTLDRAVFYVYPAGADTDGAGGFVVERGHGRMSLTALFREVDSVLHPGREAKDPSSLKLYKRRTARGEPGWPALERDREESVAQIRRAAGEYARRAVEAGRATAEVYGGPFPLSPL